MMTVWAKKPVLIFRIRASILSAGRALILKSDPGHCKGPPCSQEVLERIGRPRESLMEYPASYPLVAGLLLCYFGYPAFRVSVLAFGLAGGACLGYVLGKGLGGTEIGAWLAAAAGALVGTLLLRLFVRTGLFLIGALAGAASAMVIGFTLPGVLVGAVAAALLTLFATRWVLMLSTALVGAGLAAGSLAGAGTALLEISKPGGLFLFGLFFLTGLAAQVYLTRTRS